MIMWVCGAGGACVGVCVKVLSPHGYTIAPTGVKFATFITTREGHVKQSGHLGHVRGQNDGQTGHLAWRRSVNPRADDVIKTLRAH